MHPFTEQLTQALAVVGHVAPSIQTSGTLYVSSPVDMMQFRRAIAYIHCGVTGYTSGTVVAQWFAANNVAFTTTGTAASGAVSNTTTAVGSTMVLTSGSVVTRVEKMEIRADQMPVVSSGSASANIGLRWLQLQLSVSSAAVPLFGVMVLGADPNYMPANQFEATAYASGSTGSIIVDQAVVT